MPNWASEVTEEDERWWPEPWGWPPVWVGTVCGWGSEVVLWATAVSVALAGEGTRSSGGSRWWGEMTTARRGGSNEARESVHGVCAGEEDTSQSSADTSKVKAGTGRGVVARRTRGDCGSSIDRPRRGQVTRFHLDLPWAES